MSSMYLDYTLSHPGYYRDVTECAKGYTLHRRTLSLYASIITGFYLNALKYTPVTRAILSIILYITR